MKWLQVVLEIAQRANQHSEILCVCETPSSVDAGVGMRVLTHVDGTAAIAQAASPAAVSIE